jgi:hypothetical protein
VAHALANALSGLDAREYSHLFSCGEHERAVIVESDSA